MDGELRVLMQDEGVVLSGQVVNLHLALNTRLHADIRQATGLDGPESEFALRLARFPGPRTHARKVAAPIGHSSASATKLVLAEAEFDTDEQAHAFRPPLDPVAEVTDDSRFTGGSLVQAHRHDPLAGLADYGCWT